MFVNNLINSFLAEIFLGSSILLLLLYISYIIKKNSKVIYFSFKNIIYICLIILILALLLTFVTKIEAKLINYIFINDLSTKIFKSIILFFSSLLLLPLFQSCYYQKIKINEIFLLYLFVIFFSLLIIQSVDFLSLYLLLEMLSLSFYVVSGSTKSSIYASEAALKYFLLGSLFSIIFLIGVSLIYSTTGCINIFYLKALLISDIFINNHIWQTLELHLLFILGCILVLCTFLFKIGISPFNSWVADVYEGAPLFGTIYISLLPKFSFLYLFLKLLGIFQTFYYDIFFFIEYAGLLTIIIATLYAFRQFKLKRFIIYSSISQFGFIISTINDYSPEVIVSIYYFFINYLITSILAWFVFIFFYDFFYNFNSHKKYFNENYITINLLQNMYKSNIWFAISVLIIFFSMAGIPGFAGFIAKFFILQYAITSAKEVFCIILVLLSNIIAVYYYIRFIKISFFEGKNNIINQYGNFSIIKSIEMEKYIILYISLLYILLYLYINPSIIFMTCELILLGNVLIY